MNDLEALSRGFSVIPPFWGSCTVKSTMLPRLWAGLQGGHGRPLLASSISKGKYSWNSCPRWGHRHKIGVYKGE